MRKAQISSPCVGVCGKAFEIDSKIGNQINKLQKVNLKEIIFLNKS